MIWRRPRPDRGVDTATINPPPAVAQDAKPGVSEELQDLGRSPEACEGCGYKAPRGSVRLLRVKGMPPAPLHLSCVPAFIWGAGEAAAAAQGTDPRVEAEAMKARFAEADAEVNPDGPPYYGALVEHYAHVDGVEIYARLPPDRRDGVVASLLRRAPIETVIDALLDQLCALDSLTAAEREAFAKVAEKVRELSAPKAAASPVPIPDDGIEIPLSHRRPLPAAQA
jgi:hypothetical protein